MSLILDALKKARQLTQGESSQNDAQNLMKSFEGRPRARRRKGSKGVLYVGVVIVVLAGVAVAGNYWVNRGRSSRAGLVVGPMAEGAVPAATIVKNDVPAISPPVKAAPEPPVQPSVIAKQPLSIPQPQQKPLQKPAGAQVQPVSSPKPPAIVAALPQPMPPAPVQTSAPAGAALTGSLPNATSAAATIPTATSPRQLGAPVAPSQISVSSSSGPIRDPYDAMLNYYRIGDYPKALEECRKATELRPEGESTHLNCGAVLIKLGNLAEAIKELTVVTRLNDKNDMAFNNLGTAYMLQGDNGSADGAFERAIRINPSNASAHLNRALIAKASGQAERAKNELLTVVQLDSRSISGHHNLALIYDDQSETGKALEHYRRFRDLAVGLPEYRPDVARADIRIRELEKKLPNP